MRLNAYIFGCLFSFSVWADIPITAFLTTDLTAPTVIQFKWESPPFYALKKVELHFLKSTDCQSGYMRRFDSASEPGEWGIDNNDIFGLRAEMVYQAAIAVMSPENIDHIHSLLIRLQKPNKQFIYFKEGCNDQGLNCCLPISCSINDQICHAVSSLTIQKIYLPDRSMT
ncbi:MAG TPA: hypothetical protein VHD33_07030 [Legionellaceae bacterium]|nr:hypothetical protein [Legionellaceae bacterium]